MPLSITKEEIPERLPVRSFGGVDAEGNRYVIEEFDTPPRYMVDGKPATMREARDALDKFRGAVTSTWPVG